MDQDKFTYEDIKDLYNKRWATEEEFKKFMQRLLVENFSSLKIYGILQDFFANVFMQNTVSLLVFKSNKETHEKSKGLKYRRCINWTSALGDVRSRFILFFLRNIKNVHEILKSLYDSFSKNTEAIKTRSKI